MPTLIGGRRYVTAGGAVGTLSIDGTASPFLWAVQSSFTFTLTTTKPNDVIVAVVMANGGFTSGIASSNTTPNPWVARVAAVNGSNNIQIFYGVAASALTAEVITCTNNTSCFSGGACFAVNGCDVSVYPTSFVDPNGSLPANAISGIPSGLSTTKNATLIIGGIRGDLNGAPPATWTDAAANRASLPMGADYKIFSSPQSSISISDTITTIDGWVADALKASGQ